MKEKIKCQVCGVTTNYERMRDFLSNHIVKEHNMTIRDYYDKFFRKEKEGTCESCGQQTKFIKFSSGYRRFCSTKCSTNAVSTREMSKKTYFEKTGYTHNMKNPEHKEMLKKQNLENYGVEWTIQNKDVVAKIKKTMTERYGVDNIAKAKDKFLERVKTYKHNQICVRIKRIDEMLAKYNVINYTVNDVSNKIIYDLKHVSCGNSFKIDRQLFKLRIDTKQELCTHCNKLHKPSSLKENELLQFIKDNYQSEIKENDRTVIKPLELDIYLPELKLAFEFNGVFWHNELNKPSNYHKQKTELAEENGIHLIHIWEDDWEYKQDIVKSRILNLLGKSTRIFARKCVIKPVPSYRNFLDKNHIQGYVPSQHSIGLFYEDELVSLMTFGKARFHNAGWELLRFCNKLGTSVVGGAERLYKAFVDEIKPPSVISYADRSWSRGNLYEKLGFTLDSKTLSNYYYVVDGIRKNRFKYRKSELIRNGFDKNLSEHDIMLQREIYRVYDSGQMKFIYKY